jgi:hypothetical protein
MGVAILCLAGCNGAGSAAPDPTEPPVPPGVAASSTPATDLVPQATMRPGGFWSALVAGGPDAVTYGSLAAVVKDADGVILGSFSSVEPGPNYDDEYGNRSYYATVTIAVDRILQGSIATKDDKAQLAVFLGAGRVGADASAFSALADDLKASMPSEQGVFFVNNMAEWDKRFTHKSTSPYDASLYQIESGQGFIRDSAGLAKQGNGVAGAWLAALDGQRFTDVVAAIAGS